MKNIKNILLVTSLIAFVACNDEEDFITAEEVAVDFPELTAGSVDFSNYVALGASFTAGFTDGALFKAAQENSFPNILSQQFANAGGASAFLQPETNDNFGGLAAGGNRIPGFNPRLVFGGAGPVALESIIGPVTVSTDVVLNNPPGPFKNLGVPGAKSFHILAPGYGSLVGIQAVPPTANPYFVRMASSASTSVLMDAMAQSPTFFSLSEIGGNDVLGYATSGGDGSNPITPSDGLPGFGFDQSFGAIVATLTSGGAKGVVTNVPYITDLPHFTTVTHNVIPLDAATAGFLNSVAAYGAYNAGLDVVLANAALVGLLFPPANGMTSQEIAEAEIARRKIVFAEAADNAVVIFDENLTDLTSINPALRSMRQATAEDLFVLPSSSFIGTEAIEGNPQTVNGVAIPLADKWVLTPEEQKEIKDAIDAYNITIESVAAANGLALVDLNDILSKASMSGIETGDFTLTTSLVTGGLFSLDGIHPTARGYAVMANEFMRAIDATYGSNFEASGSFVNAGDYPTNYSPTLQ